MTGNEDFTASCVCTNFFSDYVAIDDGGPGEAVEVPPPAGHCWHVSFGRGQKFFVTQLKPIIHAHECFYKMHTSISRSCMLLQNAYKYLKVMHVFTKCIQIFESNADEEIFEKLAVATFTKRLETIIKLATMKTLSYRNHNSCKILTRILVRSCKKCIFNLTLAKILQDWHFSAQNVTKNAQIRHFFAFPASKKLNGCKRKLSVREK